MLEYRVLSSAMMKDTNTLKKVWKGIERTISAFNNGKDTISREYVISAINNSDIDLANKLIKQYRLA